MLTTMMFGSAARPAQAAPAWRARAADTAAQRPSRTHGSRLLLQFGEQRERFERRHAIHVERREPLAQPIVGGRRLEQPELALRFAGVPLTDGRPPRVSSSRSSAARISRARSTTGRGSPASRATWIP